MSGGSWHCCATVTGSPYEIESQLQQKNLFPFPCMCRPGFCIKALLMLMICFSRPGQQENDKETPCRNSRTATCGWTLFESAKRQVLHTAVKRKKVETSFLGLEALDMSWESPLSSSNLKSIDRCPEHARQLQQGTSHLKVQGVFLGVWDSSAWKALQGE